MLYGNVIFIKKSGGDGSKFPVTSTNVCIGRSDDCVIRIQNPLISPQQCKLTIENNGQAKIENLSTNNPTILNDRPLGVGKHVLLQGDILKLGERLARWEYLPSSKHYYESVVAAARYKRNSEGSIKRNTELTEDSTKKHNKTFTSSGRESLGKSLRVTPASAKFINNRKKLLIRNSLQLRKLGLSPQVKLRICLVDNSVSETPKAGSRSTTPARKSQKWEVKSVSPSDKVKPPCKSGINRKSTPIKLPMAQMLSENGNKSSFRSNSKAPNLVTIAELPHSNLRVLSKKLSLDDAPDTANSSISAKTPLKTSKTPCKTKINSQKKSAPESGMRKSLCRELKDFQSSFNLNENTGTAENLMTFSPSERSVARSSTVKKSISQSEVVKSVPVTETEMKNLSGVLNNKRKSSILRASNATSSEVTTPNLVEQNTPPNLLKSVLVKSGRGRTTRNSKASPVSTPKQSERLSRKSSIPSGVLSIPMGKENVNSPPRKRVASSTKKPRATTTPKTRGVKRKNSVIASAERAAKKLKTIIPAKPDKNKKAALLVLGKAGRKLKVPQNTNIVMKKKIVKRAIKQFTRNKKKPGLKKCNKASEKAQSPKVVGPADNLDLSPETLTSSIKMHSTPIGKGVRKMPSRKSVGNEPPLKSEASTQSQWNKKTIGSISRNSDSDSAEILPESGHTRSSKKRVSFNSTSSSIECESRDLGFDVKHRVSNILEASRVGRSLEFREISPIALGLTPKQRGSRSFSVATPKNKTPVGIMKSASTSKIARKLVSFSNVKLNDSSYVNLTDDSEVGLNKIQTPDVSIDFFVSPLSHKKTPKPRTSSSVKFQKKESSLGKEEDYESPEQSPKRNSVNSLPERKTKSPLVSNLASDKKTLTPRKSPKNNLTNVSGVGQLMESAGRRKSPKNDLTDVRGVRRLMESAGRRKSPKNDLTDVRGVRRLMESAGRRKSPKNDLTDVRGVRRLMESAGRRKSPKNDLTDVRGVRRLMESAGRRKSPKNDLTDVRGVRRLFKPLKQPKSPKNDLTDVTGVKQLLIAKSPKNDLTNISGLEKLFKSPPSKIQCLRTLYNPASEISGLDAGLSGLRKLFSLSKMNNLDADLDGVAELFTSPQKTETPTNRTRNAIASPSDAHGGRTVLLRSKTGTKKVGQSDIKTRKKGTTKSEIPKEEQNLKKPRIQTWLNAKVEESISKRTRSQSGRKVEMIEEIETDKKNSNVKQVTTGRSSRKSSKLPTSRGAVKRQATLSKSPPPVKRTRKGLVKEEVTRKAATKSDLKEDLTASGRKSSSRRTVRKSTARSSPKAIKKVTRVKASESEPNTSRSPQQRSTRTTRVKKTPSSPIQTRQRRAKTVTPVRKRSKSRTVKARRAI